ncbi:MFS transporter [Pseudanabaena sp. FACHB-1277]|jgi:MFS family permease|uniref:MFS transporter n=1 Tax=Pseudanabaena cinerea FACHB-1277 TaxID=2949581 RepID=A0A926URB2_9CYAN|nr:MFS transporter [Pseudanabaena cinerea]MBD2149408.1 MFS transporter [Pseudanabaena cinerea FACHB-1277]
MTHLFDPPTPNLPEDHHSTHADAGQTNGKVTEISRNEAALDVTVNSPSVLKNPNFLSLWSGQVFSQIADKIFLVLVIAIVSTQFQQRGETISGWVSAVMVSFTIPAILFGSIAGVYVDRWNKKTVLVSSNIVRGLLVICIPLLLWATKGSTLPWGAPTGFWGLLAITFCVSTFTQFFTPAEQSAITLVVDKPQLLAANSLYTTTIMAALILGFALGEPLLALSDHLWQDFGQEALVGGSYLLAGLILLLLKTGETKENLHRDRLHIWEDIKEGLQYLRHKKTSLSALIQLICTFSIIAALTVLAVRLAEVMPEIKSEQFGFLLAVASVGMAIGAGIVAKLGHSCSRQTLALIGSLGMAVFLGMLAIFSDRFWLGLVAIAGTGIFGGLCVIPMQTVIQEETPEEVRGKVFGLQNNAVNIALSLPLSVAGIAESYFGLQRVIFSLSAIALLTGLLTWYIARQWIE